MTREQIGPLDFLMATQKSDIEKLRAEIAVRQEVERGYLDNLHQVEDENLRLRAGLAECHALTAAQADVIEAQRVNLDAARIVIEQAHSAAEDAQGEWLPVAKPHLPLEIFKLRQIDEILSAALEGVEADGADEYTQPKETE